MTTAATSVTAPSMYSSVPTTAPKQKLDGETFLKLLVTQLRSQDPSSPMNTNEMMSQTTQLASMEQLTSLANLSQESFSLQMRLAASSLIGKDVSYTGADGKAITGRVTSVSFAGTVPLVTVGGENIRLDAISGVAAPAAN